MTETLDPWGPLSSQTLSRFLVRSVRTPREFTPEMFREMLPRVLNLLLAVSWDGRFGASTLLSGSYVEGLKVSEPEKFEFLVPLEGACLKKVSDVECLCLPELPPDGTFLPVLMDVNVLEPSRWCAEDASDALCRDLHLMPPGSFFSYRSWISQPLPCTRSALPWVHIQYRLCTDEYRRQHTGCGVRLLNPDKVTRILLKRVCAITGPSTGLITVYQKKEGGPAVTLKCLFNKKIIDVDLVPLIKKPFHTWSFYWPRYGQLWPSEEKIQKVKETGVDLVAKHYYYWRYSFVYIERVLLEKIDEDGGQRLNSLWILKKVQEDLWKPKGGKVLESHHLKTLLFWACEAYPTSNDWQDLAQSFKRLVDLLLHFLSNGHFPHYFVGKEINLLKAQKEDVNAVLGEVRRFRGAPMEYFQRMM